MSISPTYYIKKLRSCPKKQLLCLSATLCCCQRLWPKGVMERKTCEETGMEELTPNIWEIHRACCWVRSWRTRHEHSIVPAYICCLFIVMLQKAQKLLFLTRTHYSLTEKTEQDKRDNYLELCSQVRNRETFAQAQDFPIFHAYSFISFFLKFLQQDLKSDYNNGNKMFRNYFKPSLTTYGGRSVYLYDWGMTTKFTSGEAQRNHQCQLHKAISLE